MGNETSVPEADGLQPPSQIAPDSDATSMRVGGKAVKLAKAVLQKATHGGGGGGGGGDQSDRSDATDKFYPAQEQYSPNSSVSSSQQQQQYYSNGGPKSEEMSPNSSIPVMYASEGGGVKPSATTAGAADKAANSIRTSGQAVRNGGRALINSMRNLTVATAGSGSGRNMSASGTATAPRSGGLKKEENEWESNWDEDDEDDSSESDEDNTASPAPVAPKPLSRPPNVTQRQQQQPPPPPMPTLQQHSTDMTTAVRPKTSRMYEKPNVQMFLPLLRVLGKGSFGKVRYCFAWFLFVRCISYRFVSAVIHDQHKC
jgi:hypothetical protein